MKNDTAPPGQAGEIGDGRSASGACPAWCQGGHSGEDAHSSGPGADVELSLAEPISVTGPGGPELIGDYLNVSVWEGAGCPVPDRPCISLRRNDAELADMAPAEALALAIALVRASWRATPQAPPAAAGELPACPPWCEVTDEHEGPIPDDSHFIFESVGLSAYSYTVNGERYSDVLFATRKQLTTGQAAIMIEKPDAPLCDEAAAAGVIEVAAKQAMLTPDEAVEAALAILRVTIDPVGTLAARR